MVPAPTTMPVTTSTPRRRWSTPWIATARPKTPAVIRSAQSFGGSRCSRSSANSVAVSVTITPQLSQTDHRSVTDRQSVSRIGDVPVNTLRARQAEATRQLLVSVARELFTDRGYAGTSVEEIIQRAGV